MTHTRTHTHAYMSTHEHTHTHVEWMVHVEIHQQGESLRRGQLSDPRIKRLKETDAPVLAISHVVCLFVCNFHSLRQQSFAYTYIYIHLYYIYYIYIHIIYMYIYLNANVVCSHVSKHLYCCTNDNKRSVSSALRGAQRRWSAIC